MKGYHSAMIFMSCHLRFAKEVINEFWLIHFYRC